LETFYKLKKDLVENTASKKVVSADHFIIEKNKIYAGLHIILDIWGINFDNSTKTMKKIMKAAVKKGKATLLHIHLHKFGKEEGISGVAVLAESHISVHTWPERDYMAFDIFMCGDTDPFLATEEIIKFFKPNKKKVQIFFRGESKS